LGLGAPLSKNLNKPVLGFWGGGSTLSGFSSWDSFLFKLPLDEEDKEEEVDSFADVDFLPKKLVMEVVAAWG
jgi:hypothetical protein